MNANKNVKDLMEFDSWLEKHPFVFESELSAIQEVLPETKVLSGIEVGLGTGRYCAAIGIKEGVETTKAMRKEAQKRGILTRNAVAGKLPYDDLKFDFVLMVSSVSLFERLDSAFHEANRVLKNDGALVIGFIDKESTIGQYLKFHKSHNPFYQCANLYSVDRIISELTQAGFQHFTLKQTLFGDLESITSYQPVWNGYGNGSFVVIKAHKKFPKLF